MAIMPLVIAPDARLNQPSKEIRTVTDEIRTLLNDMADTMYYSRGIGLAAVQIGIHLKAVVVDVNWRENDDSTRNPMKLINPTVIWSSEEEGPYKEGCLSFPDQFSDVERPLSVRIAYLDENGTAHELLAEGLLATCIQHEIDHTNGINFVDHISRLKRDMILKKLTKLKKAGAFDEDDHVHGPHCSHGHHHHDHHA